MRDDAALLRRYAIQADDGAFRVLVERNLPLVYSAALRQVGGDKLLAEDVTQSVFYDLAQHAQEFASDALIVPWLYRATRFAASVAVRGERRRHYREHVYAEQLETVATVRTPPAEGESSSWDAAADQLDSAVNDLPEQDRHAILLRFFEGLDFRAVGEALRTNDDTAQKRVSRALEKLRSLLAHRGVALTGAALAAFLTEEAVAAAPPFDFAQRVLQEVGAGAAPGNGAIAAAPSASRFGLAAGGATAIVLVALLLAWRDPLASPERAWPGLVSRWTADGHTEDVAGRNPAYIQGNVTFVPGVMGQAFHFDGKEGTRLTVPDSPSLNLTNELTMACWFCPDEDSDMGTLMAKRASGVGPASEMKILYMFHLCPASSPQQWGIAMLYNDITVDGGYHLSERAHGTNYFVSRRNKLEQLAFFPGAEHSLLDLRGQWHHLAGTCRQLTNDQVEVAIYFDGLCRARRELDGSLARAASADPLVLGGFTTAWFKGSLDEIQIYQRVLTEAEIQRLATRLEAPTHHARK